MMGRFVGAGARTEMSARRYMGENLKKEGENRENSRYEEREGEGCRQVSHSQRERWVAGLEERREVQWESTRSAVLADLQSLPNPTSPHPLASITANKWLF